MNSHAFLNFKFLMNDNGIIIIMFNIDDFILVCNNKGLLLKLKSHLAIRFQIKDLKEVHYILGMQIARD